MSLRLLELGCLLQASLSCGQEVQRGGWLTLLHARIHAGALTFNVEARGPSVVQAAVATVIVKVRLGIYKVYKLPAVGTGLPPTASRFLFSLNRVCPILRRGSGGLGLSGRQLGPLFAPELHLRLSQRLLYLPSLSFLLAHFVQFSLTLPRASFPALRDSGSLLTFLVFLVFAIFIIIGGVRLSLFLHYIRLL